MKPLTRRATAFPQVSQVEAARFKLQLRPTCLLEGVDRLVIVSGKTVHPRPALADEGLCCSLQIGAHELVESHATRSDDVAWQALRMSGRLPLQIVEHRARLCGARVHDCGPNVLDRSNDAVRGDQLLLASPSRLSVAQGPAVVIAAVLSDSLGECSKAACDNLTRARFGRRVLADGTHRASPTAYAHHSSECDQEDDRRNEIH